MAFWVFIILFMELLNVSRKLSIKPHFIKKLHENMVEIFVSCSKSSK